MDLSDAFGDTVTVASCTGSDASGKPTFGSQRTISGALKWVREELRGPDGTSIRNAHVFFTDQPIAMGDLIWLPGADTTNNAKAKRLGTVRQQSTLHSESTFYEVDL